MLHFSTIEYRSEGGPVVFRDMAKGDINGIVAVIRDVSLGYMSRMPAAFIRRYFENIFSCSDWSCRVAILNGTVAGFYILTFGKYAPRHAPFFKSPLYFIFTSSIFLYPLFIIMRYVFMEWSIKGQQIEYRSNYDSELVYIAIRKQDHGSGIGRLMLIDMRHLLGSQDIRFLGTEYYKGDKRADRYYKKFGYEKLGEINTGGRMSISLRYPVDQLPSAELNDAKIVSDAETGHE